MTDLYRPLFQHLLFPAYESGLRRRKTLRHLREYEAQQWRSTDEIYAIQWRKLQALIAHCWTSVPFYRTWWGRAGLSSAAEIRSLDDYARLPALTKPVIRAHAEALVAPQHRDALYWKTTGGSTGEPLRFGYTRESYERRVAVMLRGYGFAGARHGERTAFLWGAPVAAPAGFALWKDRLYHAAFNRRMFNAFDMSEARIAEYVEAINRFRPDTVVGYVGPLDALAAWAEAHGRALHRPRRVLGAAEALHPHQRERIGRAFGAPVFDTYGCREFMLIAAECEAHDGLHINADHLLVEFGAHGSGAHGSGARDSGARDSGANGGDGPADLVITDLHNVGMPLMRYVNGDLGTRGGATCRCGRGLPKLAKVDGRRLDALRMPDGRLLPGEYVVYVFLPFTGIRQYQVVQRETDALLVRLVPDRDFDPSVHARIEHGLRVLIGEQVRIAFEHVDAIALTPSGKRRVTVCELAA